jgi:phosphoglycolate phosphatase
MWPQAVIFDLDGTLIDSAPDLAASLNEVLGRRGVQPISLEGVKGMIGGGIPLLITRALLAHGATPGDIKPLVDDMMAVYETRATLLTKLFDGAEQVIRDFRQAGVKMAVCTNKLQQVTDLILRELDIAQYFTAVIGARPLLPRKPDPTKIHMALAAMETSAAGAVMVGDSSNDAEAARAAGIPVVLAAFGYSTTPVDELSPDAVIVSLTELPEALRRIRTPT